MDDYELQLAFLEISQAKTPPLALKIYERNYNFLKDWRFIYATDDDHGAFKLKNTVIDGVAGIKSIFRGKSLWVIDANMCGRENGVNPYIAGTGIYFDSNAASFISSLAYKEKFPEQLKNQLFRIQCLNIDYANINPYVYLFEQRRHFTLRPETIEYSKLTFASLTALKKIGGGLDESWRDMYKRYFREQCENDVTPIFDDFLKKHDSGFFNFLDHQFNLVELLLLETKILEASKDKSNKKKLEALIHFMDEKLEIMMLRELSICADILFEGNKTSLTKKLRKINSGKFDPISIIQNCAWDLNIFRIMDWFSNTSSEGNVDFYISNIVSCDRDIWGISDMTSLKGMALHNKSHEHVVFPENSPQDLLKQLLGDEGMDVLSNLFSYASRLRRIGWTQADGKESELTRKYGVIQDLLHAKREELMFILHR